MNAKCNIRINKYKKPSSTIPKSSKSFEWKDVNWKKIELRLNVFQNKIYAAQKKSKYPKGQLPFDIIETDHIIPIAKGGVLIRLPTYTSYMLYVMIERYKTIF